MIPGGDSVVAELWALLTVVLLVYLARLVSRRLLLGSFRKLQIDDYIMTFNIALFIIVIFSIWLQCLWGNNYVTPEDVVDWTPEDFHVAIEGAKWGVAMETCKITCVWGCKACLLILYAHMTKGLPKYHRAVLMVSVYVGLGYFIVMICFFAAWCHPFHAYYDVIPVPASETQCMTYRKHMLLDAAFNITSDAAMLCLPIPLVIRAKVPLARKLVLVFIFSLGGLVILCAILNRVTNFTAPYGSLVYLNWYAGETATAVIVANVPHLWPLISRIFGLSAFKRSSRPVGLNQYRLKSYRSSLGVPNGRRNKSDVEGYTPTGSEEGIAGSGDKDAQWGNTRIPEDSNSSSGEVEMGSHHMTTSVHGGDSAHAHGVDQAIDDEELGGRDNGRNDRGTNGQIMKTVHIHQYASDP